MQTRLTEEFKDTPVGREADSILRSCVHCGFCTATCPTYQLLGDELDGPRGRIYLIKQVLEGAPVTARTQLHLDRCLTCRNCETSCPSGVQFGRLLDIGRKLVDERVPRPWLERVRRATLQAGLTGRWFAPAYSLGQALRAILPASLKAKLAPRRATGSWPTAVHARRVLLLEGCVQPAMAPNINTATARVLDAVGIEVVRTPGNGVQCCGALRFHLDDQEGAAAAARRNIDAWWPGILQGVEAIVVNASGCGVMVKDYWYLLAGDPAYAEKAARVSALARDPCELLPEFATVLADRVATPALPRVVFHPPCTLQHGQQIRGVVEELLQRLGAEVLPFDEQHLCCGSAGSYSLLQPALAGRLRDRKIRALEAPQPDAILSANIGCIAHLAGATQRPVLHWIEWLDQAIAPDP
jgi:glycolate dehydrogenase iron-sulfur subunit